MAAETAILLGASAITFILVYVAINVKEETISWVGRLGILMFSMFSIILLINTTTEIAVANGYSTIAAPWGSLRTGMIYLTVILIFFYMFMKLLAKVLEVPNFSGKIGRKLKW